MLKLKKKQKLYFHLCEVEGDYMVAKMRHSTFLSFAQQTYVTFLCVDAIREISNVKK